MKTCRDMENLLPLYAEGAVTDEEKRAVEEHLAACAGCRKELAYLKKAGQLVADLPPVEEPPWFQQKIMAQVRKEAEKKSLARKWFYPLRFRIPLQIMATVVIAVLAVYIYRSGEDRMKQVLPGVQAPGVELSKEQARPQMAEAPKPAAPAQPRADAVLREESLPVKGMRKEVAGQDDFQKMKAPESPSASQYATNAGKDQDNADKSAEKSVTPERLSGEQVPAKDDIASSIPSDVQERKAADAERPAQAGKARGRMALEAAKKKEAYPAAASPAAPRSMEASVTAELPPVSVSLRVKDVNIALADIEKLLPDYNARITSKQMLADRIVLRIILSGKSRPMVLSRLREIGQVTEKTKLSDVQDQPVLMTLEIIPL